MEHRKFFVTFRINLIEKRLTKKGRLSTISSVYDPGIAGIAATFVLEGWKILQKLCKLNVGGMRKYLTI